MAICGLARFEALLATLVEHRFPPAALAAFADDVREEHDGERVYIWIQEAASLVGTLKRKGLDQAARQLAACLLALSDHLDALVTLELQQRRAMQRRVKKAAQVAQVSPNGLEPSRGLGTIGMRKP